MNMCLNIESLSKLDIDIDIKHKHGCSQGEDKGGHLRQDKAEYSTFKDRIDDTWDETTDGEDEK